MTAPAHKLEPHTHANVVAFVGTPAQHLAMASENAEKRYDRVDFPAECGPQTCETPDEVFTFTKQCLAWLQGEYAEKGEEEPPELWAIAWEQTTFSHRAYVRQPYPGGQYPHWNARVTWYGPDFILAMRSSRDHEFEGRELRHHLFATALKRAALDSRLRKAIDDCRTHDEAHAPHGFPSVNISGLTSFSEEQVNKIVEEYRRDSLSTGEPDPRYNLGELT